MVLLLLLLTLILFTLVDGVEAHLGVVVEAEEEEFESESLESDSVPDEIVTIPSDDPLSVVEFALLLVPLVWGIELPELFRGLLYW
jgi:hypothetical protein